MREVNRSIPRLLNLRSGHTPGRINQKQDVARRGSHLGFEAVSRPEGQLTLFVKRE